MIKEVVFSPHSYSFMVITLLSGGRGLGDDVQCWFCSLFPDANDCFNEASLSRFFGSVSRTLYNDRLWYRPSGRGSFAFNQSLHHQTVHFKLFPGNMSDKLYFAIVLQTKVFFDSHLLPNSDVGATEVTHFQHNDLMTIFYSVGPGSPSYRKQLVRTWNFLLFVCPSKSHSAFPQQNL